MAKKSRKRLFDDLEAWAKRKNSFSINDFLKEKNLSFNEFENLANGKKKFMQIWEEAESQTWENIKNAIFTKSLHKSKIAQYIAEQDAFRDRDPEEVVCELERGQKKLELHLTAIGDIESLRKYGRTNYTINQIDALILCSLERGLIIKKDYEAILAIYND